MTFEKDLNKLEDIVNTMENESPNIEDALKLYEEGLSLVKKCQKFLQKTEQKIFILKNPDLKKEVNETKTKPSIENNFELFGQNIDKE